MTPLTSCLARGLMMLLLCATGCKKPAAPDTSTVKDVKTVKKADQFQQVVEILQAATETAGFREALAIAGNDLSRPENLAKVQLSAEARAYMRGRLGLDNEELADIEATTFSPLDAHHVQQCFLLRDAARAIERSGSGPLELAQQALSWVDRHVLLLDRVDGLMPPTFTLQTGEGTADERALVFLAILDQLQIMNCLVSLGEADDGGPGRLFAGVIIGDDKKEIYLFDSRLAGPLPGARGVCTFAELRKDASTYLPDRKGEGKPPLVRVFLPVSMPALSPRMRYLENRLAVHDRVTLAAAPERWHKIIADAAGQEALPWTSTNKQPGRSPLRMLAAFLPPGEGGRDNSRRRFRTESRIFPWMDVQKRYVVMRLHDELPPPAQDMLFQLTQLLFKRYDREPRQALAGGHTDRAAKRLEWARGALDDFEFAPLADATLRRHADMLREQVNAAYLALFRKQPGGQEQVNRVWGQDQYMGALLLAKDRPDTRLEKLELSLIMLSAIRETLGERVFFLNALCWHDLAERSQAALEAQQKGAVAEKDVGKTAIARAAKKAAADWLNARGLWQNYVERLAIAAPVPQRLEHLRQVTTLDYLAGRHQELASNIQRSTAARLFLAMAQLKLKESDAARSTLEVLRADLASLRDSPWQKDLAVILERVPAGTQPVVRDTIKGVSDYLGPDGGIFWMQKRIDALLSSALPKS